jgi:hypothetical protein
MPNSSGPVQWPAWPPYRGRLRRGNHRLRLAIQAARSACRIGGRAPLTGGTLGLAPGVGDQPVEDRLSGARMYKARPQRRSLSIFVA